MNGQDRFLVVGSDGLIGHGLISHFLSGHREVWGTTRHSDRISSSCVLLDLEQDFTAWRPPPSCSVAFLCAAVTNQEMCRQDPGLTRRSNVTKTVELARILIEAGMFVVFLSTNLVFDGSKPAPESDEAPNPQTEYGRQKTSAEESLLAMGSQIAVVRLSKVFYPEMPLLNKWVIALRRAENIFPLNDLVCSPISLEFVVQVLERVGRKRAPGIFQVSGDSDVSYAEIAMRLTRLLKAEESLVHPASSLELGLHLEHLPEHTTMDVSRLAKQLNLTPPTVWTAIDSVFADLVAS